MAVPRSRKRAWLRDESILALHLYLTEGKNAALTSRQSLSDLLRSIPIEEELAADPNFRGVNSVSDKLSNFVAMDPGDPAEGLSKYGAIDKEVWDQFAGEPSRLAATSAAIRSEIGSGTAAPLADGEDPEEAEAAEGALLTGRHRRRERSSKLVKEKKAQAMDKYGELACEACGFDFATNYGERGRGFIECHHTIALRDLKPGSRTKLSDLALLCSNCHRIVHRKVDWLTMSQLIAMTRTPR